MSSLRVWLAEQILGEQAFLELIEDKTKKLPPPPPEFDFACLWQDEPVSDIVKWIPVILGVVTLIIAIALLIKK